MQNKIRHLKIGLTGNIGSGKSTAARFFAEIGIPTFDADRIGHALLESNEEVRKKILDLFGEKILVDHKINRSEIAKIVFDDHKKRTQLEQILHPAIFETLNERIMDLPNVHYAIIEGALIYEACIEKNFDYIVLVKSDKKTAINRASKNLNMGKKEVMKRLDAQMPQDQKEKLADFVISNNGTLDELKHRVNFIHSIILSLSKQPVEA